MTDGPPRPASRQLAAVSDPTAPLQSHDVEELLKDFADQTRIIILERLRGLSSEVHQTVHDVLMETLRDIEPDRVSLISQHVEERVRSMLENTDRADLGGRAVKIRMHRAALVFAERYRIAGVNSRIEPSDQDRPTVRLTPMKGTKAP